MTKPATVTINLTVTYTAKENMTLADLGLEGQRAQQIVKAAKDATFDVAGVVTGTVVIGKQKFPLGQAEQK